jgi:hypothetical protein
LKIVKKEGVLNIEVLALRLPLHSSSLLECVKGKVYNEKIHLVKMIIQDINTSKIYVVEFLHKSKILASKKIDRTKNYINRFGVH